MLKKLLFGLAMVSMLSPLLASAATHSAGTNVLSNGTIYMISTDGQLRPYTSAGAFLSYGFNSWNNVEQANSDDLALPVGDFIPPRDGKIVCSDRGTDKGTCYLITNGKKAGFTGADVFNQLGFNFKYTLSGDVSFLPVADNISDATQTHLPGTLINDNGTVKLVGTGGTIGVPSMDTLKSWGYSLVDVVKANTSDKTVSQTDILTPHTPGQLAWNQPTVLGARTDVPSTPSQTLPSPLPTLPTPAPVPPSPVVTPAPTPLQNDITPPAVSIIEPSTRNTAPGPTITISAVATDDTAVIGVQFIVNGNNIGLEDTSAPFSVTATLPVTTGYYNIRAEARDSAGNIGKSQVVSLPIVFPSPPPSSPTPPPPSSPTPNPKTYEELHCPTITKIEAKYYKSGMPISLVGSEFTQESVDTIVFNITAVDPQGLPLRFYTASYLITGQASGEAKTSWTNSNVISLDVQRALRGSAWVQIRIDNNDGFKCMGDSPAFDFDIYQNFYYNVTAPTLPTPTPTPTPNPKYATISKLQDNLGNVEKQSQYNSSNHTWGLSGYPIVQAGDTITITVDVENTGPEPVTYEFIGTGFPNVSQSQNSITFTIDDNVFNLGTIHLRVFVKNGDQQYRAPDYDDMIQIFYQKQ